MSDWYDIRTAPIGEEARVDLWVVDRERCAGYRVENCFRRRLDSGWIDSNGKYCTGRQFLVPFDEDYHFDPMLVDPISRVATHWMPRPEAPHSAADRIERAAIMWDGRIYSVPRPGRHHDVFRKYPHEFHRSKTEEQGFVTQFGRFVNRYDALFIAMRRGQIRKKHGNPSMLFSEDMW